MSRHTTASLEVDPNERDKDLELKAIREEFREPLKRPVRLAPEQKQVPAAKRIYLNLPVEFVREDGTVGRGQIENISSTGVLVLASPRPAFVVGERILLYLGFLPGTTMTSLRSRIVRLHPLGIGATFEGLDERAKALLHQLLPRLSARFDPRG
jgi:hypothetical protein